MIANNYISATKVVNNLGNIAASVIWNTNENLIKWQSLGMFTFDHREGAIQVHKIGNEDLVAAAEYEQHLAEIMR